MTLTQQNESNSTHNKSVEINLEDFDFLELQSLIFLNQVRVKNGMRKVVLNQELMAMAQNEADRLANQTLIGQFPFKTDKKLMVQIFRLVGKNHRGGFNIFSMLV